MYRRKLNFGNPAPDPEAGKSHKLKLTIISALCAAVVILFYLYTTLNNDTSVNKSGISRINPISKEELSKDIDSIAFTFGIHKGWIRDISQKNKQDKSPVESLISKEIRIPYDLPMIDLNFEFSNYLRDNYLREKVTEDPKTKNIFMEIYSSMDTTGKLAGVLKFIYKDSLKRTASDVCIILDSIDSYPLDKVERILGSTEEFSVFLPLRNDKADYQSKVIDSKREFLLKFLIGDESEVTADFKSDMKESTWKAKVKSVAMNFQNSNGIILYGKTGFKDFENEVKAEFEKNNIIIYKDTLFSQYKAGEQKIISLFSDIETRSNSGKVFLFYSVNFSPEEFDYFDQHVYQLKKLGYKFLSFKNLVKKINN